MANLLPDPERPGAFRVVAGRTSQSYVDPADPLRLEFEYVQRIVEGLLATVLRRPQDERIRVVHVGGGGLTLARYVATIRPHTAQIVFEPDAELTEKVRRILPLPRNSGIKVRALDGRAGVASLPDGYVDALILDAFAGASVPAQLGTAEFFAEVARTLRPGGVLFGNITDRSPFDWARRALAGVQHQFRHLVVSSEPSTWKGRRFGNLVLFASSRPLPAKVHERDPGISIFPYRVRFGSDLTRFIGGATPYTDADAEPSPGPPGGLNWFT